MLGSSMHRVQEQTDSQVNQDIRRKTEMNIAYYAAHPDQIAQRLRQLEEEWDVERVLELNSSILSLLGLVMGLRKARWLLLPIAVQSFFLQHTVQGWCPPVEIIRRLGYREQSEIATEYYALKTLRGDFQHIERTEAESQSATAGEVMEAVRR